MMGSGRSSPMLWVGSWSHLCLEPTSGSSLSIAESPAVEGSIDSWGPLPATPCSAPRHNDDGRPPGTTCPMNASTWTILGSVDSHEVDASELRLIAEGLVVVTLQRTGTDQASKRL